MSLHLSLTAALIASAVLCMAQAPAGKAKSIYDFSVKRMDGSMCSMSEYKGHPLLIVNVASK